MLERQIKDVHGVLFTKAVTGVQCVNLTNGKVSYAQLGDISRRSVDGAPVSWPQTGPAASAYGRFFLFVKGGVFVGNPLDEAAEPMRFIRLFDFGDSGYFSRRTVAKPIRGGVLVGFSSHTGSCCLTVIASSLFPRTPLGPSSGLGAFRVTPGAPHLGCSFTYLLYVLIAVTTYKPT